MAVAEELIALLGFEIKGEDKLKRWNRDIADGEKAARRTATAVGQVGVAAERSGAKGGLAAVGIGKLGGALAGIAVGGKMKEALTSYADFERRMTRIGVTAGATVAETMQASTAVQDFAQKFALPVDEARQGLDTLVSSGMNLKEAMSFLPSVLAVAQASGASTEDIANTAQKSASAFGLSAKDMGQAFDTMVTGGKLGQFELRDMAHYLPSLSAEFSTLGYKGQDGLRRLIALLQTARMQTGTAEEAARNASNLFGKIYSAETGKKFKKMGIDVRKELDEAKKSGKDVIEVFSDLVERATKGDQSKLALLFEDTNVRRMVTALTQLRGQWRGLYNDLDPSKTMGATERDLKRILANTEAGLQRLANSRDRLMNSAGASIAPVASPVMDAASEGLDRGRQADDIRREKSGSLWNYYLRDGGSVFDDKVIADDKKERETRYERRRQAMLRRPSRAGGVIPFASGGSDAVARTSSAFDAFPGSSTAPAAAGFMGAAMDQLKGQMNAKIGADTSAFMASMDGVKGVLRDFAAGATAVLNVDTAAAERKIEDIRRKLQGISGGASGSWNEGGGKTPTPARVVEAGARP